jgi:Mrp family chromosome partitioning ATPase
LVDANLRSPRLSRLCELEKIIPFPAESGSELEYCAQVGGNLWLAGAGLLSDGCGALLSSTELKRRLTQLRSSFEYLLLDGPGLISSGDGAIIGGVVDAAILVVEAGRTRRVIAGKAKDALDAAGIPLLGTILHNRVFPIPEGLYKKI